MTLDPAADLAALEAFFEERGAEVFHEVSPLAGLELLPRLAGRGFRPVELTSVMHQPIARLRAREAHEGGAGAPRVREGGPADADTYADTLSIYILNFVQHIFFNRLFQLNCLSTLAIWHIDCFHKRPLW